MKRRGVSFFDECISKFVSTLSEEIAHQRHLAALAAPATLAALAVPAALAALAALSVKTLPSLSRMINNSTWNSNLNPYSNWNSKLSLVFNLEFQF